MICADYGNLMPGLEKHSKDDCRGTDLECCWIGVTKNNKVESVCMANPGKTEFELNCNDIKINIDYDGLPVECLCQASELSAFLGFVLAFTLI